VRFVDDHEVVAAVVDSELGLDVFVSGQLVEAGDGEVVLEEPVSRARRLELVVRQDLEREVEAAVELVLPLLGEASGTDERDSA
jgi:hypothetical protein